MKCVGIITKRLCITVNQHLLEASDTTQKIILGYTATNIKLGIPYLKTMVLRLSVDLSTETILILTMSLFVYERRHYVRIHHHDTVGNILDNTLPLLGECFFIDML